MFWNYFLGGLRCNAPFCVRAEYPRDFKMVERNANVILNIRRNACAFSNIRQNAQNLFNILRQNAREISNSRVECPQTFKSIGGMSPIIADLGVLRCSAHFMR